MRPSSSSFELLGGGLLGDPDVDALVCDEALVAAMLEVEAALAEAQADAGVLPGDAAQAIARAARELRVEPAGLGRDGASAGNPVPALVRRLTAAVPDAARPWVHHGATSQDVIDTTLMRVAKQATGVIVENLLAAGDGCAVLAETHRDTVMVGRTLGQQAAPTTFGRKAAGWLVALDGAAERISQVREHRLAVQLGGAVGTLAALGEHAEEVVDAFAHRLGLCAPAFAWHTDRTRILDVAAASAVAAAAAGKSAGDVLLLAQNEVGELAPGDGGESSAMPHKRNPVDAVLVRAGAMQVPGLVATLFAAADQEHERAGGAWHAEWLPLLQLLRTVGGASARSARMLAGLTVDADRMRANLEMSGGTVMAEAVTARLAAALGRTRAQDVVARCARETTARGVTFRQVLLADPDVAGRLTAEEVTAALNPANWLGGAGRMVDRAVGAHRRRRG